MMNKNEDAAQGCAILIAIFLGVVLLATVISFVMVAIKSIQWVL